MSQRIIDPPHADDLQVTALVRGENYILMFSLANSGEALRTLGRWASDPQLSFTWYDAALLSQRIRAQVKEVQS